MKIKEFQDGSYLEYAAGNFDQWCVYMVNPSKNFRRPPLDVDYFGFLREQAKIFGSQKIYDDFVSIYNLTSNQVEGTVLDYIRKISLAGYGEKWLEFEKVYTILYMGMIAEENKAVSKVIILLTDGSNNRGDISPMTAAEIAKAMGVRVYTIGITETALSRYIAGSRDPKPEVIANIATALHTTSDFLLGIENDDFNLHHVRRMIARNASKMTEQEKKELIDALFGEG